MSSGQKKKRALLPILAVLMFIPTVLACGESVTSTSTPTNTPRPTDTAKPIDTSTLEPTDMPTDAPEPEPTRTPEPFPSGGLGASKAQWEQEHTEGETIFAMIEYDNGAYLVTFVDDKIQHLELTVTDDPNLDNARTRAETFIPEDSQFQETYSPEGFPELIVDLYTSESLGKRFASDWVWFDSEPGTFIVIYSVYDGNVARILMATGNNP